MRGQEYKKPSPPPQCTILVRKFLCVVNWQVLIIAVY